MKNDITITGRAIVVSIHASGVMCAYDSQHWILKVSLAMSDSEVTDWENFEGCQVRIKNTGRRYVRN